MAFDFVKVAVRQIVLVEELSIQLFDGEIEAIVVAFVLIRSAWARVVDDIELRVVSVACLNAGELKELEANALEQTLFSPVVEADLLDNG